MFWINLKWVEAIVQHIISTSISFSYFYWFRNNYEFELLSLSMVVMNIDFHDDSSTTAVRDMLKEEDEEKNNIRHQFQFQNLIKIY